MAPWPFSKKIAQKGVGIHEIFQLGIPNVDRRARSLLEYFLIVLN